jgi:pyruvate/2-oxoglutarate dehydrogenase complex dihydrolipoamide dehydrogenase (E3) component
MPSLFKAGRPAPVASSADEVSFECDVLVEAIGQKINSKYFEDLGIKTNRGRIISDEFGAADGGKIFAGGDSQTGPATVILAIAAGKAAAANIDAFLGFHTDVYDDVDIPVAKFDSKLACGRVNIAERAAEDRTGDFDGVEMALLEEEAHQECGRCLRCDHYGMGALRGGRPKKW